MSRKHTIVLVVLAVVVLSAGIGWAANVYWRNNQYLLPSYNMKAALQVILTDHKQQIDAVVAANVALEARVAALEGRMTTAEGNIGTNAGNITTNTGNIASNLSAINSHVNNTGNAHSHDARYVRDSGENLRVIRGLVDSSGTILSGSGFTVTKGATGVYTINYGQSFAGVATPVITSLQHGLVNGYSMSGSSVTFTIDDASFNADDDDFTFVILGLQ